MIPAEVEPATRDAEEGGPDGGFLAMQAAFERAAAMLPGEVSDMRLRLAGRPARLRVAGAVLAGRIGETFAHLREDALAHPRDDGSAHVRDVAHRAGPAADGPGIDLWDRSASGVERPPPPGSADLSWAGDGWRVTTHASHRYMREERPGYAVWLDRRLARAVGVYDAGAALSLHERARPLMRIVVELHRSLGVQDLHAGLVSREGRGALLVGGHARGKTSCALDCLEGGLDFLGDDTVGLERAADGDFVGHSLFGSARVAPSHLARWPDLAARALRPGPADDKALLLPIRFRPAQLARRARIAVIILPRVTGGRATEVARVSGAAAMFALAHESRQARRFELGADDFARLAALVKRVPCYRLEPGADPAGVARAVTRLLDEGAP